MQIVVEDGYVAGYALYGDIVDGIVVDDIVDDVFFMSNFRSFKYENGSLIFDPEKQKQDKDKLELSNLRTKREEICFPIVNRGSLWYDRLTEEQTSELSKWYQDWLDVTNTRIIPETPEWVN